MTTGAEFRKCIRQLNELAATDATAREFADRLIFLNENPSFGDYDAVADEAIAYVKGVFSLL